MKNIILLLTFISALAYGASGTVELGPTIGGGGGGGAPTGPAGGTLSGTYPDPDLGAILATILPDTDNAYDFGATLTGRFRAGFFTSSVSVGRYPFGGATPGAAIVNGAAPGLSVYNGGSDAYNIVADAGSGVSIQNPGAGVSLLNVQNHQFTFMDSTTDTPYLQGSLSGITAFTGLTITTTTGALTLPRMSTADRDALTAVNGMEIYNSDTDKFQSYENSAWVDAIGGGGSGANTNLSNLDSPTAINQDLIITSGKNIFLANNEVMQARNAADSAYLTVIGVDSGDQVGIYDGTFFTPPAINVTSKVLQNAAGISVHWGNRQLVDGNGSAVAVGWNDPDNVTIGDSSVGKNLVLRNNNSLSWRKADDSADIPVLFLDAFNRTTFGDGLGTNTVFNNSFIPSSALSFDIGTGGDEFRAIYVGSIHVPGTITAGGTTGAQTINKTSGTVNFAALASSLVVTDSFVSATSIVLAVVRTADSTATIKNVVPGSGSFTITLGAAATAETSVGFLVINQ